MSFSLFLRKFLFEGGEDSSDPGNVCHRASICIPPISPPGPGPATNFLVRSNLSSHEVDVDALVCCNDRATLSSSSKPRVSWGTVRTWAGVMDEGEDVLLHVYNLNNIASTLGLDIYHVGVEVFGCEVWYGTSGIRKCKPKSLDPQAYIQTVLAGQTTLSVEDVRLLVHELEGKWVGKRYRWLDFNCQSFALDFCKRLGVEDTIPREYVRHGDVADWARRAFVAAISSNPQEADQGIVPSTSKFSSCSDEMRKNHIEEQYITQLEI